MPSPGPAKVYRKWIKRIAHANTLGLADGLKQSDIDALTRAGAPSTPPPPLFNNDFELEVSTIATPLELEVSTVPTTVEVLLP